MPGLLPLHSLGCPDPVIEIAARILEDLAPGCLPNDTVKLDRGRQLNGVLPDPQ